MYVYALPEEDWLPPGKRPRNSYMTNLDGLCQGGPEQGKYPKKLPGLVKGPKSKQRESLEEFYESLIVGTADGREERRRYLFQAGYKFIVATFCMHPPSKIINLCFIPFSNTRL